MGTTNRPYGPMDKAPVYGTGDSEFEPRFGYFLERYFLKMGCFSLLVLGARVRALVWTLYGSCICIVYGIQIEMLVVHFVANGYGQVK